MKAQTATTWTIDPMHSDVQFKVRHMMISTVTGSFSQYEGQVEMAGDDFTNASISFSAEVASISTGNEQRDGHLKSPEFFDIEQFPTMTFTSTGMTKTDDDTYKLTGDLMLHGVTKSVALSAEYGGQDKNMYGQTKAGFELTGTINRKDFGLVWSGLTETGGVMLGDDVKLAINIQLTKQG